MRVVLIDQQDRRLGRQIVHDPRSRGFAMQASVDPSLWISRKLRVYDPLPNPNQPRGNCTGVSKCVQFNTVGNRVSGQVLKMDDADRIYSLATSLDPWPGEWPPEDTGSSGLGAAKAAQQLGLGGEYRWLFGGADECVSAVVSGLPVSVGTYWTEEMFTPDADGVIQPLGQVAGGHQYTLRGYDLRRDLVLLRCWWGPGFRDVWIRRDHLNDLLLDDGDAHVQVRTL